MSADDNKSLDEASSKLVASVLADQDKNDEIEDEFVKSLLSAERKKTPSPPPAEKETKEEEEVKIIDTDPIGDDTEDVWTKQVHHEEGLE